MRNAVRNGCIFLCHGSDSISPLDNNSLIVETTSSKFTIKFDAICKVQKFFLSLQSLHTEALLVGGTGEDGDLYIGKAYL